MADCGCEVEIKDKSERRVLIILLLINGVMFAHELGIGWWAQSTALIADVLNMLADAIGLRYRTLCREQAVTGRDACRTFRWQFAGIIGVTCFGRYPAAFCCQ